MFLDYFIRGFSNNIGYTIVYYATVKTLYLLETSLLQITKFS